MSLQEAKQTYVHNYGSDSGVCPQECEGQIEKAWNRKVEDWRGARLREVEAFLAGRGITSEHILALYDSKGELRVTTGPQFNAKAEKAANDAWEYLREYTVNFLAPEQDLYS